MNKKTKQFIAFLIIGGAALLIYFAAYLPYVKASLYISALRKQVTATSVEDFIATIDEALNFWSPVGQPEEVRFFIGNVVGILNNKDQDLPQEVAKKLTDYALKVLDLNPLGAKGLNYSQSILLKATLLNIYGQKYGNKEYLSKAEEFYKKGIELSPKRPQFLYGLLTVYMSENKNEEIKKLGEEILKYWPQDTRVKQILETIGG